MDDYVRAAAVARVDAFRLLDPPEVVYPFPRTINYRNDQHMVYLTSVVNSVAMIQADQFTQRLLAEVNAEYSNQMRTLARMLPNELQLSRSKLDDALTSFAQGHGPEAVLFAREAWEACVNFGIARMPGFEPRRGQGSLHERSVYVLNKIIESNRSDLVVSVKELFDRVFLHVLESSENVSSEEIPFFIAYTTGFAHLVAYHLLSPSS